MMRLSLNFKVKVSYLNCIRKTGSHYSAGGLEREIHNLKSGVFPSVLAG